jgi:DNA (cytosine-5)-methyltransferase 1
VPDLEKNMSKLNCISLFSGGGGLDLGLEAAGFETLVVTDVDQHSCAALEKNKAVSMTMSKPFLQKAQIVCDDVKNLSGEFLLQKAGLASGELDLLAGGPPCQAFSVFGKRKGRDDARGMLAYTYLRLISELRPKVFIFENVYGMMTVEGGSVFADLKEKLAQPSPTLKYHLSVLRVNAVDFGAPQFRDRVFIIGALKEHYITELKPIFFKKNNLLSNSILPWRTVSDGLRHLPKMGTSQCFNHIGRKHSQRIIDRYKSMQFGERDSKTRINKLNPERPSFAIIVGSDAGGGKGHIHPYEPREVTPRESARMQCFPDWWWFSGTGRHPIRQVGNAVPSLLGAAVGREVLLKIFGGKPNSFFKIITLLDQTHLFSNDELECLKEFDHLGKSSAHHSPTQE